MQCPQCDVELNELSKDEDRIYACPDCAGLWLDGSQLNAHLLHHTLPGLDTLGGRADPDATTGTCRTCGVSLTRIEQTGKRDALSYEACEDCGFVFEFAEENDTVPDAFDPALKRLMAFFKRFRSKA